MSPSELDLRQTLHHDAERIDATGDFALAAIGLERRRARRRTTIAAAAAVTALAVATPMIWSNLRTGTTPAPATSSTAPVSPSPSPSPSATATGSPTSEEPTPAPTLDADAPPSATSRPSFTAVAGAPDVSNVHGTTVHDLVRHREVTLEVAADSQLGGVNGLFADGSVLGSVLAAGDWDVVVWDGATGAVRARLAAGTVLTFDSAHTRATYIDGAERLHVIRADGTVVATAPRPGLLAVGIIGDVVYVNDIRSERQQGYTWNLRTEALEPFDGRFGPAHAGSGLVVFLPAPDAGSGTCFRLLDARADLAVRWTACGDFYPTAFSPSGELLVGGLGIDGGSPYDLWVMRSSDGARVLHVDANRTGLMLTGSAVDDRDQALTVVAQNADLEEGLVRCPLDGSACTVVGKPERLDTTTASGISPPAWQVLR
ncbi:hypothetical protein [Intrasporangium calvum]|uniref:Uncharacterized protein n=1 Tax=Intrasporangium calvum (strain ATCC 23552 / DSM 43043 / JCM 3097 / NBRC 12989 / NCIMB 10167 / NRRL B-3866 / 7 KIP) TaxID=710696 RepID=E6SAD1_INTC7|nr:hypothetical protein [Intrasporangium calvum]ADU49379.1 hypothetical protein Intca_2880 [Intrasporangium calvum DSM 43043]